MKTKFIYVIMAVLLMGSQMTLSAQNTDNKQKKLTTWLGSPAFGTCNNNCL